MIEGSLESPLHQISELFERWDEFEGGDRDRYVHAQLRQHVFLIKLRQVFLFLLLIFLPSSFIVFKGFLS